MTCVDSAIIHSRFPTSHSPKPLHYDFAEAAARMGAASQRGAAPRWNNKMKGSSARDRVVGRFGRVERADRRRKTAIGVLITAAAFVVEIVFHDQVDLPHVRAAKWVAEVALPWLFSRPIGAVGIVFVAIIGAPRRCVVCRDKFRSSLCSRSGVIGVRD